MPSLDPTIRGHLILGLLFISAAPAAAQQGSLAGRISDGTGRPIGSARVEVLTTSLRASTDSVGRYRINAVPAGRVDVRISALGFAAVVRHVTIQAGRETELSESLAPSVVSLGELEVRGAARTGSVRPAEDISDMVVMAGAKSEVLEVDGTAANLAEKSGRQVFARLPGIFVYDMDGSGNQVNVATRGLDPHRSWELNVRQNGVLVNSDIYGYPASHYSLPLEAVGRIEYVRGTAALQYGPQFGGLLNYISHAPDTTGTFRPHLRSTAGSRGLVAGFGSVSGKVGKVTYSAYASARRSDGYRRNAEGVYDAQYLSASVPLTDKLVLRGQVGRSYYRYQIPGPLNDSMFNADARSSTRSRNWFSPDITVPALRLDWQASSATRLAVQVSAVLGVRNSVQFTGFATTPDLPSPVTGEFATRVVDIDNFRSYTSEIRLTHDYRLGGLGSTLAAGVTLTHNDLHRRQQGTGTRGSDYDLSLSTGDFGRDVHHRTRNAAVHAENLMRLTPRWTVVPGVRVEHGTTRFEGRLAYYDPANVPNNMRHRFPLFGLRTEYRLGESLDLYGGWSEAYRPMLLKDVLPENALERTDSTLKDASGWTAEVGLRGRIAQRVTFDVTAFALRYNNRFGGILQTDATGSFLFKTNVGSSLNRGIEVAVDALLIAAGRTTVNVFTATSFYDATYKKGTVSSGGQNRSIVGNRVESVPRWITRNGVNTAVGGVSASFTVSHVSSSFADALNTVTPTPNGAVGLVPAYTVADLGFGVDITSWMRLRGGVSNLFDKQYFTKRPSFYPGPGVWPSDGRSIHLSGEVRR